MQQVFMFNERRSAIAFLFGATIVTVGVCLHLPLFWLGRNMGFRLAGMPMDVGMLWGMALIVAGIAFALYGLLPKSDHAKRAHANEVFAPPEDAPLTRAHWTAMGVLAAALVIDIMKPASLGFVTPGMRTEYHVDGATVAWLPFAALSGTVVGSFVWGALADLYGRRASILLSSVMFVGTSICGAMPSLWWNVAMCFLMGAAAGGMLPVAYALLAEIMPTKHRGWALVLVGGIGAVGGYFAASGLSALLQPFFGWRIMWLLNLPTGLIVIALSGLLPESARFLQHMGRTAEAHAVLARFGAVAKMHDATIDHEDHAPLPPVGHDYIGTTIALTLASLAWGLVNFGLLLWLPSSFATEGISVSASSAIIAKSSLIAAPLIVVSAWLYSRWSTKWSLVLMLGIVVCGLIMVLLRTSGILALADPIMSTALLLVGSTGSISILLPYTAESYPLRVRGRATGWVAGCSKLGGLLAQALSLFLAVPPLGVAAVAIALPAGVSLLLVAAFGVETRGRDFREIDTLPARSR